MCVWRIAASHLQLAQGQGFLSLQIAFQDRRQLVDPAQHYGLRPVEIRQRLVLMQVRSILDRTEGITFT